MLSLRKTALFLLLLLPSFMQAQESDIDWEKEIGVLERELVQRHPDLFSRLDSSVFFHEMELAAKASDGKGKMAMALKMQQVVARLGDPNTRINYHFHVGRNDILPMRLFWFKEGLVVLRCEADSQGLVGRKIIGINGHPLEVVVDSLASLVADPTPSRIKSELPLMLTWIPVLEHFGFAGPGAVEVEAEDPSGNRASYRLTPSPTTEEMKGVKPASLPVSWENKREYFNSCYLPENRIYYIQYNKCWSREMEEEYGSGASALFMPSYKEFEKVFLEDLRKKKVEKLVLDIRFNDGGKTEQGTRMVEKLAKTKAAKKGNIYLIIGRDTRDAALVNALNFMNTLNATVLGEASGGRPNHFGEPGRFVLTSSGLVVSCSGARIQLQDGNSPALEPDLVVQESFEAYMQGLDPALEVIGSQAKTQD